MGLAFLSALIGAVVWLAWDAALVCFTLKAGKKPMSRLPMPSITVVLCVRNGEVHLDQWLQAAKGWKVPIIVVDDGSEEPVKVQQEGVQLFRLTESKPGKKDAVSLGIRMATTEWVALTDVDCRPSADWLDAMMAQAGEHTEVVLGVSLPTEGERHMLALVDALSVARRYAAAAGMGQPFMGVGRNLAYRRDCFPGFKRHAHLASGDDDLLVQDWPPREGVLRSDQIRFSYHNVPTFAPPTTSAWRRMKRRHLTAGNAYPKGVVLALALPSLGALLFVLGTIGLWVQWTQLLEPDQAQAATVNARSVLHIALWIVHVGGAFAWLVHVLTFRLFATQCGLKGLAVWGGVLQPAVFLEQLAATARVTWESRFGLRNPPTDW